MDVPIVSSFVITTNIAASLFAHAFGIVCQYIYNILAEPSQSAGIQIISLLKIAWLPFQKVESITLPAKGFESAYFLKLLNIGH